MRATLLVLATLLLAGCAAQPGMEAEVAMDRQVAACRVQFPGVRKNFLDRARCEEPNRRALLHAVGAPSDQIEPYLAAISDLAAQIDRGKITPWQARAALARERALLAERERWRHGEDVAATGAPSR